MIFSALGLMGFLLFVDMVLWHILPLDKNSGFVLIANPDPDLSLRLGTVIDIIIYFLALLAPISGMLCGFFALQQSTNTKSLKFFVVWNCLLSIAFAAVAIFAPAS